MNKSFFKMAIIVISLFSLASCGDNRNNVLLEGGHFNEPIGIDGFGPPPAPSRSYGNLVMFVTESDGSVGRIWHVSEVYMDESNVNGDWVVYVVLPNGDEHRFGIPAASVLEIRQMQAGEY
jgi:hypothetical protein